MKTRSTRRPPYYAIIAVLVLALLVSYFPLMAQTGNLGNNAVCTTSACSSAGQTTGSASFIDASVVSTNQVTDFCGTIYFIFTNVGIGYPSTGAVIDARGMTNLGCSSGTPWNNGTFVDKPSTILLPPGTIVIPQTWILPSNTHLIGEGDNIFSSGMTTTLQANSSMATGTPIIQFGSSTGCSPCTAISVENLNLDGNGLPVNGIVNAVSQDFSYVDHVSLYRILGTGLSVSGTGANNSGPYSSITFDTGSAMPTSTTVCVNVNGSTGTRGFRGLSCTARSSYPPVAILLDASNNSIKDVRIAGFNEGIRVGSQATAQSNVLINILGDTAHPGVSGPIYTVHIENVGNTVTDLSIMGASNSQVSGAYTIYDDLTSTYLFDGTIGLYALGKPTMGSPTLTKGYSRFTTSPNVPTWATGTSAPTGSTCAQGSVYSCSGTSSSCTSSTCTAGHSCALFGCRSGSGWVGIM